MSASRRARRLRLLAALGTLAALAVVSVGPAAAGTGLGALFNLGRTNTVNTVSTLKGATSTRLLQVTQTGNGAGIQITTKLTAPPLKVNSSVKVANLNADKLDGYSSENFLKPFPITQVYGPSAWARNDAGSFGTIVNSANVLNVTSPGAGSLVLQLDLVAPVSEFGFRYALGAVNICMNPTVAAHVDLVVAYVYAVGGLWGGPVGFGQDTTHYTSLGCVALSMDTPTEGGHAVVALQVVFNYATNFGIFDTTATWVPMGAVPVIAAPAKTGVQPSSAGRPAATPRFGEAPVTP